MNITQTLNALTRHGKVENLRLVPSAKNGYPYTTLCFNVQGREGAREIIMGFPSKKSALPKSELHHVLEKDGDRFVRETQFYSHQAYLIPHEKQDSIVNRYTTKWDTTGGKKIKITEIDKTKPQVVKRATYTTDENGDMIGRIKREYIENGKVVPGRFAAFEGYNVFG